MRPVLRLRLPSYAPRLPNWPEDLDLTIAVIADIHACYPWMSEERVGDIVDLANAQKPDLTVLLGDYVCTHRLVSGYVPPGAWAEQLARLEAPLGVYAILGNHDWWWAAIPTEPPIILAASAGRLRRRVFRCWKINRCDCPSADGLSG